MKGYQHNMKSSSKHKHFKQNGHGTYILCNIYIFVVHLKIALKCMQMNGNTKVKILHVSHYETGVVSYLILS